MPSVALPLAVAPIAATAALLPIGSAGDQSAADRASMDLSAGSSNDAQDAFHPGNFADALKHHMSDATPEDGRAAESKTKTKTDTAQDENIPTAASQAGAIAFLPNDLTIALARLQASSTAAPVEHGTLARTASLANGLAGPSPGISRPKEFLPASPDAAAVPNPATTENFAALAESATEPDQTQRATTIQATAGQPPANALQNTGISLPANPNSLPASVQQAPSLHPQQSSGTQPSDRLSSGPTPPNSTVAASLPDGGTARSVAMPDLSATVATRTPVPLAVATAQASGTPAVPATPSTLVTPTPPITLATPEVPAIQAALSSTVSATLQGAGTALDRPAPPAIRRLATAAMDASAASAASELHEPPLTTLATPVAAPSSSDPARPDTLLGSPTLPAESSQPLADGTQTAFAAVANLATSHGMMARQDGPVAPVTVHTPFGAPSWSEEIGKNLVWQAGQDQHKAELVLTPPHLGRIEISITIKNDEANASFVSANPAVRDALEQAMPRLREMLANSGITLGQANVGADSSASGSDSERSSGYSGRRGGNNLDLGVVTPSPVPTRQGNSLVDTFA